MGYTKQELEKMTKTQLMEMVLAQQEELADIAWRMRHSEMVEIAELAFGSEYPDTKELEALDNDFLLGKLLHAFRYFEFEDQAYQVEEYLSGVESDSMQYVLAYGRKLSAAVPNK